MVQDTDEKVEAFLDIDAGNHRQDRPIQMGRIQFKFLQQRLFVLELSRQVGRAVRGGDQVVRLRIPERIVDTIENTDQAARSSAKDVFETIAEFSAFLDLASVGRADGCNEIGIGDPYLHEVQQAVKLKRAGRIKLGVVESGAGHRLSWEQSLVPHVVDREDRTCVCECAVTTVQLRKVGRHQTRLMIVAVKNIQQGKSGLQEFHGGALEEDPAIGLIGIVPGGRDVDIDPITIEEPVVPDEKDLNGRARHLSPMHVVWNTLESQRNGVFGASRITFEPILVKVDDTMPGNNNRDGNTEFLECKRKRADNITQSANLGEGYAFTGDHYNVKRRHSGVAPDCRKTERETTRSLARQSRNQISRNGLRRGCSPPGTGRVDAPSRKCREASFEARPGWSVRRKILCERPPRLRRFGTGSLCRGRNGDHSPPPARIRTYRFPISGSCLRSAAKAGRRIRMTDDSGRNPSIEVTRHAVPRQVASLAPATQPFLP